MSSTDREKEVTAGCEGCTYHWMHSSGLEMCDKDWDCSKDMTINTSTECEKDYTV